jgi:hypothetical protein
MCRAIFCPTCLSFHQAKIPEKGPGSSPGPLYICSKPRSVLKPFQALVIRFLHVFSCPSVTAFFAAFHSACGSGSEGAQALPIAYHCPLRLMNVSIQP